MVLIDTMTEEPGVGKPPLDVEDDEEDKGAELRAIGNR